MRRRQVVAAVSHSHGAMCPSHEEESRREVLKLKAKANWDS